MKFRNQIFSDQGSVFNFEHVISFFLSVRAMRNCLLAAFLLLLSPSLVSAQTSTPLQIAVEGHGQGFLARQKAVGVLGKHLDNDSIQTLCAFMNSKTDSSLSRDELLALKDAACSKLDNQETYPADLPDKLMGMYADTGHDVAWRDYCIQHLNTGFSKSTTEQRKAISKVFWAATQEQGSTIAGTALIALNDNSADANIDKVEIAAKALKIVQSNTSGNAAKTTALQICAQLGEKKCLPVARELSETTKDRTLKMSAIAAMGMLGGRAEQGVLEDVVSKGDRLFQSAARTALERMEQRLVR